MACLIWFILFFIFIGCFVYYFYFTGQENELVIEKAKQNTAAEGIYYEDGKADHPFVLEGESEDSIIFYAASYYYSIPKEVRSEFWEKGWQVILTEKDISREYYNGPVSGRIAGLALSNEKKIYIQNKRSDIRRAMIHEFGHFFDYDTDMSSGSTSFKKIYENEKGSFKEKWKTDNHSISNEQEYFAEAFAQILLYPDILKDNCPKTFNYINELIDTYIYEKGTQ